ncbi:MAG: hypothetical protein HON47_04935 [Candidatus Diapherotrites archaeon]|jgi:hypothetical protein|uniref:Yip1 domain-containing protein n=1 Tax=Candidatus Iainarchaeum sp. TaxID=3101447 RepID=A0A8T5GFX9_9ARCH|nr:hypothetical protein [Candidatus Diapherotrites archaeon]MBT7241257.1 hypothetical protein [Candidatus Diapherotrites archaeon]
MSFNIFLHPTKAFQYEIENPSVGRAILFVIATSLVISLLAFMLGGTIEVAGILTLTNILQWLVLSIVLYIFEFMFSPKKGKIHELSFKEAASMTGKLWMLMLISAIVLVIGLPLSAIGLAIIGVILLFLAGIFLIINSYIMIKVALDIETKRAIIPWILIIVVYVLLITLIMQFAVSTLPVF